LCLARAIFDDLKVNGLPNLVQIDVWETPTSCASYDGIIEYESMEDFRADLRSGITISEGTQILINKEAGQ
jgi:hypothetical protein